MNQLVSQQAGGALVFKGTVSEPATVTVGGTPATVTVDNRFEGQADVPEGTGQVDIVATDPSGNVRTSTYEVSQAGAGKTFTYDLNGNMTSDGARTYEWDAENRLVAVKEGATTVASYTYNSGGIRVSKTVGAVTTEYVLDGSNVVEERQGPSVTKHFQGPGNDNVLGMEEGGGAVTYLARDHLGSIREQVDPAGTVTLRRDYDPWGNMPPTASASGWGFTGREWEPEIGLSYYRARWYGATLGRFLSIDPVGGSPNGYLYVRNRPLAAVDPSGLVDLSIFTKGSSEDWVAAQLGRGSSEFWVAAHGSYEGGVAFVYATIRGGDPHDAARLAQKIREMGTWRKRPIKLWVCNAGTPRKGDDCNDTFACDLARALKVDVVAYNGKMWWEDWRGKGYSTQWGLPLEQGKTWITFKAPQK
jgi:RHS repeat-associated protein